MKDVPRFDIELRAFLGRAYTSKRRVSCLCINFADRAESLTERIPLSRLAR